MTVIDSHDDECRHGIFPPKACTICSGKDHRNSEVAGQFPARFGTRLDCGHKPDIGETIYRLRDDRLVCGVCTP